MMAAYDSALRAALPSGTAQCRVVNEPQKEKDRRAIYRHGGIVTVIIFYHDLPLSYHFSHIYEMTGNPFRV